MSITHLPHLASFYCLLGLYLYTQSRVCGNTITVDVHRKRFEIATNVIKLIVVQKKVVETDAVERRFQIHLSIFRIRAG